MRCASIITVYTCPSQTGNCNTAKPATQILAINNNTTCSATETVALTMQEWQTQDSPFRMSLSEGAIIGGAILAVWATAYGIKALVRTIGSGEPER
jgi:hypothetical protein